jgi:hypothetical protein
MPQTEFWVQIAPEYGPKWGDPRKVVGVHVEKFTKKRPENPTPGARLVKVVLDVPADNFTADTVEIEVAPPTHIRSVG